MPRVGNVTLFNHGGPWFFKVVFHGFLLVFMVFQGGFMVFHGFDGFCWFSMVFQGGFMDFMVFGWFPLIFKVVS